MTPYCHGVAQVESLLQAPAPGDRHHHSSLEDPRARAARLPV